MPSKMPAAPVVPWPRVSSRRSRQLFAACIATLSISLTLLLTYWVVRWRATEAVHGDTRVILNQTRQQLLRAIQSRRGTLTLLRDTLEKAPGLREEEQEALSKSAVSHTRHLLGLGLARANQPMRWWTSPSPATAQELAEINRTIANRTRIRNAWRVPMTFTAAPDPKRPLLLLSAPLRGSGEPSHTIIGVFDLRPLLADFFELTIQQPYPVHVLDRDRLLYASKHWSAEREERSNTSLERTIQLDALQWTLRMQPGSTQVVRTISALRIVLVVVSALAGIALIGVIWLLAMRTWFLERAVGRRTAALRRTTERLRQLATTDELSGLYNRRFFLERWQWEYERAKRYERPLGCLMIDVNHFKQVNDLLGHPMGDTLLKHVAQELTAQLRQSDILARYGGDEFIVALPETTRAQASAVAEKLRELSIRGPWTDHPQIGAIHLSVGMGYLEPSSDTSDHVLARADNDLYATRRAARVSAVAAGTA